MNITRRHLLKMGAMAGVGLALPLGTLSVPVGRLGASALVRSPRVEPFTVPLPIPPVARPVHSHGGADHYEITQRVARQEILPGLKTEVWGYDGIFPGPTIEARRGRQAVIRQTNELPVPVSVHLHGGKTPPGSDGYPTDLILPNGPGGSQTAHPHGGHAPGGAGHRGHREYRYPNEHRAAALWYHDHRMDFTGPQVYRGLAGMYVLGDEVEDGLPLPKGGKDVPLMICDRTFGEDGSFYYPSLDPTLQEEPGVLAHAANGMLGDTILVNGAPWPQLEVSNTMHRFRILNASNARSYDLVLDPPPPGGRPFVQVGSDGGLLEAPIPHTSIVAAPAERFDVVVDFSRYPVGTKVTLRNLRGEGRTSDVMRFVVARGKKEEASVPERLAPDLDFPDPDDVEVTRRFRFIAGVGGGMSAINGEVFDPGRIDARPRLGSTEIWEISADPSHPFHMHLVHFKVLSRDDGPPGPYDAGWKDTVSLEGGSVRVAARFEGWRGKYVFHCHNLEHEDMMMMANFEVI
ncbi:MAG: Laccase [uncultured Rubrobacteraceae bacterium]|uniref:Laccase n=1 Tax=uncultured Rubrobacteraceae bacterium TaxID=349277 RepID=A0A6J4R108_9ACTN|nr:MAG: Laccase [uncultured Rubrobacteraceae bacterium]